MNIRLITFEKLLLVIFVFVVSVFLGWHGERMAEKFMAVDRSGQQSQ